MPRYTVRRDDEVLGKFTAEQIKEQIRSGELLETDLVHTDGFADRKPISVVSDLQCVDGETSAVAGKSVFKWTGSQKCIGFSILFTILTFWMSEATFRPPLH